MRRLPTDSDVWRRAHGDPLVLAGLVLILTWVAVTLPWLDLKTRQLLSQGIFDPLGLLLPTFACVLAARRASDRREATFWWLVAVSLFSWLLGILPRIPGTPAMNSSLSALWADIAYVAYYVFMFVAASLRPGEEALHERVRLETVGFVGLLASIVLYSVMIPANLTPELYASRMSSFSLYFLLDLLLLVVFIGLARDAQIERWRWIHRLIATAAAGFVIFDALQGLWIADILPVIPYGTPIDPAWQTPVLFVLVAARIRDPGPAEAVVVRPRPVEVTDSFPGRLILFATLLPVLHLLIYGVGLGDPRLQRARIFVVLVSTLLLQGLAVIESRRLARRNARLKRDQLQAAASLQMAHYWETVGRLTGGIAHEFNNILTAILGHASMLRETVAGDHQASADLDVIEASAERAGELVRQMLAFGHRQFYEPEQLDLGSLLQELCTTRFTPLLSAGVELRTDLAAGLPQVQVDRQGLVDVLTEVVANAAAAMPDGGSLNITTRVEHGADYAAEDDRAVIVVRDSGVGMGPDVLSRVFEPFFTTKDVGQGSGLGLSSALGTMQQMGGEIEISSQVGDGTEVTIRLPNDQRPSA